VADELLQDAYDQIKAEGKKARALCPYAVTWFKRHPEAKDILTD
jgi:predicted GNAT family acetyltransferase